MGWGNKMTIVTVKGNQLGALPISVFHLQSQ
jgi:hypothetical protein